MEEQLISYATAILAKKKEYNQNPYVSKWAYLPKYTDGSEIHLNSSLFCPERNVCVVVTQSLLQKWLREVHNLHIGISVTQFGYGFMYSIIDLNKYKCVVHLTGGPNDKFTYEEALEFGLQKALELI